MSRPALLAIALGAASALPGCDAHEVAATALAAAGRPSYREVAAPEARRLLRREGVELLQAFGEARPTQRAPGARLVAPDEPLYNAATGRRFVVVSQEPEHALRLGARLARAGALHVAVVADGLPATGSQNQEE